MTRRASALFLGATLVLSVGCGASAANRSWREIKSGQFHVISSVSDADTTKIVRNLRSFHTLVEQISGTQLPVPPVKIKIYVFEGQASLDGIRARGSHFIGMFIHGTRSHFSWIDAAADSPHRVAYHEYVHLLLQRSGIRYPWWYEEGLAEFLSTAVFLADKVELGRPPPRGGLVKLKALAFGTDVGPSTGSRISSESDAQEFDLLYTRAWALVSFALLGHLVSGQDQRPMLTTFLGEIASGRPEEAAFRTAFGMSLDDFVTKRLYPHIRRDRFPMVKVPRAADADSAVPRPRRLSTVERLYELGELHLHLGNYERAAEHFQLALNEFGDYAPAVVGLAVVLSHQGDVDGATTLFGRAIALSSDDAGFHVDFGNHLLKVKNVAKARDHYRRAIQLAPNHPEAYAQLGASYSATDASDAAEGIAALKKADELAPHTPYVYLHLGVLYARAGYLARARKYLQMLPTLRQSEPYVASAKKLLTALSEDESAAEDGSPDSE